MGWCVLREERVWQSRAGVSKECRPQGGRARKDLVLECPPPDPGPQPLLRLTQVGWGVGGGLEPFQP